MSVDRKRRDPYFPFFGSDFYESEHVLLMTWEERGLYQALLWHAWLHGSIPEDPAMIARLVRAEPQWFAERWRAIAPCWTLKRGRLHNERVDHEREARDNYASEQRRKSELGNAKRWGHPRWDPRGDPRGDNPGIPEAIPERPLPSHPIPSPEGKSTTPSLVQLVGTGPAANSREDLPPVEGRGGVGREGFDLLMEIGYRSKSNARSVDILAALRKFGAEGGDIADLKKLCGRAKRKGRDPGGMMAKWLDGSEWQKELQRR